MPPPSIPTGQPRTPTAISSSGFAQLPKIFLLVLVAAAGLRFLVQCYTQRKRRTTAPCSQVPEEKGSTPCQAAPEADLRPYHLSQSRDQVAPAFTPIYPWISPPQPLPGPYDPRFFPLPTIRRHSHDVSPEPSPEVETHTASYTRRVSTNSMPVRQSTLHGAVSITNNRTRRNQWVVTGG